jgi:hypothetical protein
MKKILFIFVFLFVNTLLFSQSEAMKYFTMGFNARNYFKGGGTVYFLYGYENYSETIIFENSLLLGDGYNSFNRLSYSFPEITYFPYNGRNNSTGYRWVSPGVGYVGEERKIENGRLVYWAMTEENIPYFISDRIEQNTQRIIIHIKDHNYQVMYYNVSENEIFDLFYRNYLELIIDAKNMVNNHNADENQEYFIPFLSGRTSRELALFRNCMYAIKGYRFSSPSWAEFFSKYLKNYNGQYSNDEVLEMFTENELWLLNLVIQFERER